MEQIAIIGMGCRFPGAPDLPAFWQLMCDGVDAITEVPTDRFDIESVYDPRPATSGKIMSRWGGFLEQVDRFDAAFFGISPREAARMDPQHRLLLEVAWEAVEDAGLVAEKLSGVNAGVFIGIITSDYWDRQFRNPTDLDVYSTTGSARSGAAGRIAYALGLQGISVAVDAACSSSLVAVHLACQSLRTGSCCLAIAGGVNIILNPDHTIGYSQGKMMAPDGRCKTFDARADGYVRSEGAGVVVLKPLSQALADGDPIYAVIRGSAVNNDGHSDLFMTPSVQGQRAVLHQAYRDAGVSPGQVQYVEAHGTGTSVGDPVELKALGSVLAEGRAEDRPCIVGSVKTNIGHTEGAAGLAGLIKVALCLKHRMIPPNLHFHRPNPAIPWQELPLVVAQELMAWPQTQGPLLAGVSSFGIAGTNAHIVVEEAPRTMLAADDARKDDGRAQVLTLSAHSFDALKDMAGRYQALMTNGAGDLSLQDVCYSASLRRTHHDHRLAAVGCSLQDMGEKLGAFLREEMCTEVFVGRKIANRAGKIAWIFPGQGGQWLGMGRDLLEQEPVFRATIERCEQVMERYVDWSLLEELQASAGQSRLDRIDVVQPTLFAVQVALAALWRSWGIEPDAVVGHSMGEVAAACVAGALSLEDAAWIICSRSKLLLRTSGKGAMAAVDLPLEQARLVVADYKDRVSIAVSNSSNSTVLSGEPQALAEVLALLERNGVFGRLVKVNVASHSPQMDPLRADLLDLLAGIRPQAADIPIYSTVTGEITNGQEFDAQYWVNNLREPVLFLTATQQLLDNGFDVFLEMSPHPILIGAIKQTMQSSGRAGTVLASLRRREEGRAVLVGALGKLYTLGHSICWDRLYPRSARYVSLPTYPWQRERFWNSHLEGPMLSPLRVAQTWHDGGGHALLGPRLQSALQPDTYFWETVIDVERFPYLNDHRIQGSVLLPSTGYIEMALAAASAVFGEGRYRLEDIVLKKALFFPEGSRQTVQIVLMPDEAGKSCLRFFGLQASENRQEASWTDLAGATICQEEKPLTVEALKYPLPRQARQEWRQTIQASEHYQRLRASGIEHGPLFQGIEQIWQRGREVMARLTIAGAIAADMYGYQVHPALFDACLQAIMTFLPEGAEEETYVPIAVEYVRLYRRPEPEDKLWSYAIVRPETGEDTFEGDIVLVDEDGQILLEVLGFRLQRLAGNGSQTSEDRLRKLLYEICWEQDAYTRQVKSELAKRDRNWLIFADAGGVGERLADVLRSRGDACVLVTPGPAYECVDAWHYRLDPSCPEAFKQLLNDAFVRRSQTCHGVIYLWSMTTAQAGDMTAKSLQEAQRQGCVGVLHLVQAVSTSGWEAAPRFWLVTSGSQAVTEGDRASALAQAPVWGLGRVIVYEHPDLRCTLVDIEADCSMESVAALAQEIWTDENVDEVALRGKERYIARLEHWVPQGEQGAENGVLLRPDSTYLITGGLGGVGLTVARWMVGRGARHLALLSRSEAAPEAREAVQAMRVAGAEVRLVRADVAQEAEVAKVLAEISSCMPPLRGIVHSAVVLDDSILLQLDQERFLSIMRPKVEGAWNLHSLTLDLPLDFFVLFSSAASLIGSPGQGNYAAGNAFMDALAHYRKASGYPALSINWGRWAEVGQATRGNRGERLDVRGFGSMRPEVGLAAFERLLRQGSPQVGVMSFNLDKWTRFYPRLRTSSLFARLAQEQTEAREGEQGTARLTREELLALRAEQRGQALSRYLGEQIARVLGLSSYKLDMHQQLNRLGIDSLMSVELKNRIGSDLGAVMPVATFLQGITFEQLTMQILQQV